jgi:hypothetical protein
MICEYAFDNKAAIIRKSTTRINCKCAACSDTKSDSGRDGQVSGSRDKQIGSNAALIVVGNPRTAKIGASG